MRALALHVTPLFLRLALGLVFLYAGWGKLLETMPVSGADAAMLANAGLMSPAARVAPSTPSQSTPPANGGNGQREGGGADGDGEETAGVFGGVRLIAVQGSAAVQYTAEDFSEPVEVSRRMNLVLSMLSAEERGQWPTFLSSGTMLSVQAWGVTIIEFVGGCLVLLGLLTRFWALGFAGAMAGALWLTQIGPAMAGSEPAFLGFLPPIPMEDPVNWMKAWMLMFFQFTLLCGSMALACSGAGGASLDALVFREKRKRGVRVTTDE